MTASLVLALLLPAAAEEPRGSIRGRVVCVQTGEGLRGVSVLVSGQAGSGPGLGRTAISAEDGAFLIERLPAANYTLAVHKSGYRPVDAAPRRIVLEHNQTRSGLELRMNRPGVVAGTVTDAEGMPIAGTQVTAFRVVWTDGRRRWARVEGVTTNDRGQYRLFGLDAGRYVVRAAAPPAEAPEGEGELARRAYYPGTSRVSEASPLLLRWGQESSAVDFVLRPQAGFSVAGRVLDAAAGGPCATCTVSLAPVDEPLERSQRVAPDGSFRARGLIAGAYRIMAEKPGPQGTATSRVVQVATQDLRDVELVVGLERAVAGRVVWESPAGEADRSRLNLSVLLRDDYGDEEEARVTPDLAFALPGLPGTSYRVVLEGLPPSAYLKTLRLAGRDLPRPAIELPEQGALTPLELVVAFDGATVAGQVKPNPEDASGTVLLVPQDNQPAYVIQRRVRTDSRGSFTLSGIVPGSYTAFAAPPDNALLLEDPETQRRFLSSGKSITLDPDQKATLELGLIQMDP